jgi:putative tricarboxylic transport membrane protein
VRTNDAVSGLLLIALAGLMIALTANFPPFPGQKYGPALFPRLLGAGIIVCGAILVVRGLVERRSGERWLTLAPWTRERWRVVSFVLTLGLVLAYILVSETIGFLPVAFVFLVTLFLWFRVAPLNAFALGLASVLIINYFFAHLMRVPLPRGFLNSIDLPGWLMSIL